MICQRCSALLRIAHTAAVAWVASLDLEHLSIDDAALVSELLNRTAYQDADPDISIVDAVIRPLLEAPGPAEASALMNEHRKLVVARASALLTDLLPLAEDAPDSPAAFGVALLNAVLSGGESPVPLMIRD